jgi:hypothetical protein
MPENTSKEKEIKEFWSTIWSNKIEHKEGTWFNEIKYDGQDMGYEKITEDYKNKELENTRSRRYTELLVEKIYSSPSIFSKTTIVINSKPRGNTTFLY